MIDLNIEEVVKGCQAGDKEAFRELFQTIENKALATAYFLCGDKGLAEDILQETYLKCFSEINKLENPKAFKAWFFRILMRTGWQMAKKQSKIIPLEINSDNETLFFDQIHYSKNEIDTYELKALIQQIVNNLSDNLKEVVILYYYNDMSIEEIAKITGCFKATVKSRLFYARSALKKQLNNCFGEDKILVK